MAEYGNPDTSDWEFIKTFSPYHLFDAKKKYPPVLFTTSTRDDRVHPGHARKMAAKMIDAGKDVTYYENIEGGHGGAANNAQAAHMSALAYSFLWERLGGSRKRRPRRRFPLSGSAGPCRRARSAAGCRRAWPGATGNASTHARSAPPPPAIAALPGYRPGARAGWHDGSRNPARA